MSSLKRPFSSKLPSPPRCLNLSKPGRDLWKVCVKLYDFDEIQLDSLGRLCRAVERGVAAGEVLDREGLVLDGKAHPLVKVELQYMAMADRYAKSLGLTLEPLRTSLGRPTDAERELRVS
jgi:hypothetical protein